MPHQDLPPDVEAIGRDVVDAAFRVHRAIGPGALESVYRKCMMAALQNEGRRVDALGWIAIEFEGHVFERALLPDLVVDETVVVELKAVDDLHPVHRAQLLSYLKLGRYPLGYLVNFHSPLMKSGLERYVHSPALASVAP